MVRRDSLLRAIERSRTEVHKAFDRVAEWFELYQSAEKQPFTLKEAVEIATNSIKTFSPNFAVSYHQTDELDEMYISGNLSSFVDIFFNIFDNIKNYSKSSEAISADISATYSGSRIIIKVVNAVDHLQVSLCSNKIEDLKARILMHKGDKLLRTEGGTGLYKIHQILLRDFKLRNADSPTLDFKFTENDKFVVEISLPVDLRDYDENFDYRRRRSQV